ncbi:MAG: hypothetical protein JO092_07265, partial [Candidatus Eremiobacteraeota bacterium]|nr:hypothetical protein [Candidatus Eremiobacteraeota bacterium]
GTTGGGGLASYGTVFRLTTSGSETVLHSFAGGNDGCTPFSAVTYAKGKLYGTAVACGGPGGDGSVFELSR